MYKLESDREKNRWRKKEEARTKTEETKRVDCEREKT